MPIRLALLLCSCVIFGCGSPKSYNVQAVVTLDDKPFAEAQITLLSIWDGGTSASGMTDSEGKVTFKMDEIEGVVSGTYIVTVSKTVEERTLSNNEIRALAELGIRYSPQMIELTPEKYTRRATSDLKIKVGYWASKQFSFELRSHR
jgi:hypothetical protein